MTKGHNQDDTNDPNPEEKVKGQDRHLTDSDKKKKKNDGRNADPDSSDGTKGQNNVK